jgi:hypothetical protein
VNDWFYAISKKTMESNWQKQNAEIYFRVF